MSRQDFDALVRDLRRQHPSQRHGQAVFNVASMHLPNGIVEPLRGESVDCFYNDRLVPLFMLALQEAGAFDEEP